MMVGAVNELILLGQYLIEDVVLVLGLGGDSVFREQDAGEKKLRVGGFTVSYPLSVCHRSERANPRTPSTLQYPTSSWLFVEGSTASARLGFADGT